VEELGLLGEDGAAARGGVVAAERRRNQRARGERPVSVFDRGQGGHGRPLVLRAERGRPWRPVCRGV